ncbi:MAG: hypothetical protein J0H34_16145 [Rhizobiales bacterium]|nr:hypothetical protein [Hyphomicrobiales bacterium]
MSTPAPATAASRALNNPFYNLHRLGIFFTPSPRFADLLLVTGSVTNAMLEPLKAAYEAMPEPRWVMAVGTCAVSGGVSGGGYACGHGLEGVLPVDVWLPSLFSAQEGSLPVSCWLSAVWPRSSRHSSRCRTERRQSLCPRLWATDPSCSG